MPANTHVTNIKSLFWSRNINAALKRRKNTTQTPSGQDGSLCDWTMQSRLLVCLLYPPSGGGLGGPLIITTGCMPPGGGPIGGGPTPGGGTVPGGPLKLKKLFPISSGGGNAANVRGDCEDRPMSGSLEIESEAKAPEHTTAGETKCPNTRMRRHGCLAISVHLK